VPVATAAEAPTARINGSAAACLRVAVLPCQAAGAAGGPLMQAALCLCGSGSHIGLSGCRSVLV